MFPSPQGLTFHCAGVAFFLDPGSIRPPVLELVTADLAEARAEARIAGLEEAVWNGPGALNLVADPFGVLWNIHHDPEVFFAEPDPLGTTAKIGVHTHQPDQAAEFYSQLFLEPATRAENVWVIDTPLARFRVETGLPEGPVFFVPPGQEPAPFRPARPTAPAQTSITDPYGLTWKLAPDPTSASAVILTDQ